MAFVRPLYDVYGRAPHASSVPASTISNIRRPLLRSFGADCESNSMLTVRIKYLCGIHVRTLHAVDPYLLFPKCIDIDKKCLSKMVDFFNSYIVIAVS